MRRVTIAAGAAALAMAASALLPAAAHAAPYQLACPGAVYTNSSTVCTWRTEAASESVHTDDPESEGDELLREAPGPATEIEQRRARAESGPDRAR